MDTSKTYVRMCEKAEEIQKEWKPERGDYRYWGETKSLYFMTSKKEWHHECIWVLRQDQLQEMLEDPFAVLLSALYAHAETGRSPITKEYDTPEWQFTTFEQLWLALVMKEKYGKVWNGEDWVKYGE